VTSPQALLLNCTWRFVNFHVRHREAENARDSYVELQRRLDSLAESTVKDMVVAAVT